MAVEVMIMSVLGALYLQMVVDVFAEEKEHFRR